MEGHAQSAANAETEPHRAARGMGGIEAPAAGIEPGRLRQTSFISG